jgi:hypothetical protein
MNQALYAHINNKRKRKKKADAVSEAQMTRGNDLLLCSKGA